MNRIGKIALAGALLALGAATQGYAQSNLVQTLTINLTAFDQPTATKVRAVRITTRDVIRFFAGANVPNGQLLLVTPPGNVPGATGDLNAFLRITSGNNIVLEVPSPASFNLFQDFASVNVQGKKTTTFAVNRFSIDFGAFHAELQGFSTWNSMERIVSGIDLSGTGSFTSTVNGRGTVDGVTQTDVTMTGTITAGPPRVGL